MVQTEAKIRDHSKDSTKKQESQEIHTHLQMAQRGRLGSVNTGPEPLVPSDGPAVKAMSPSTFF